MTKKKKQPLIPASLTIVSVFILMFCSLHQIKPFPVITLAPVRYDLPVETKIISLDNNRYGDYLAGLFARQNQDYDQTARLFSSALAEDSDNTSLKTTVYLIKALRGEIGEILPQAKELGALNKPELMTDYILVADAIRRESYKEADAILTNKPAYGPDGILKPVLKAWILAGLGKREEAAKSLLEIKNDKSESLLAYYQALLAAAFNDTAGTERALQEMSRLSTNGYPSLTSLAFLRAFHQKQGTWKTGTPDYDHFTTFVGKMKPVQEILDHIRVPDKITPAIGSAVAFYDVSVALATLKIEETCLILNEISLYLNPTSLTPQIWGGELMETTGNYQGANRIYRRIVNPPDIVLLKQAMNYIADEKPEKALPFLETLASHKTQDGSVHLLLADTYRQIKDYQKAVTSYTKAINLFKTTPLKNKTAEALLGLGASYDSLKQNQQAEKALLESIRFNPNNAQALNYLGYIWLDNGKNINEAFDMVKKASELEPDDPNILDSLALGYYLKKDYDKALTLAEKSIDRLSYSSVAYAHLGDIYDALGRHREAKYQYRKALDLTADITPELQKKLKQKLR